MDNTATKIALIATKAQEFPKRQFTALMHHINPEYLLSCFEDLKRRKAPGIDNRTHESYSEEEITQTLEQTVHAMKARKYRPRPVKRVLIDKPGTKKKRPLGLPTVVTRISLGEPLLRQAICYD